jgi:hypothetical protein
MSDQVERSEVAIIGAGPAGLAAGLFTREGVYDSGRYAARVHAYFQDECRPTPERESEFRAPVDDWIREKRNQQITRSELARRRLRAPANGAASDRPSEMP